MRSAQIDIACRVPNGFWTVHEESFCRQSFRLSLQQALIKQGDVIRSGIWTVRVRNFGHNARATCTRHRLRVRTRPVLGRLRHKYSLEKPAA